MKIKRDVEYLKWIREPIYLDGPQSLFPRYAVIDIFCNEGLIPFIESFGYMCHYSNKDLTKQLLRILYHYYNKNHVSYKSLQYGAPKEQFQHFLELIDTDRLISFWSRWGKICDFSEDGYAYRFRFDLPFFLWNVLNLKSSHEYQLFAQELDEGNKDSQDKTKGKDDPFLSDLQSDVLQYDKHNY